MKPQVAATVLFAASFFAIGASVERSTHAPVVASKTAAPAPRAPQRIAEVVSLPEVTVRPSAEDLALAHAAPIAASDGALPGPAKFSANGSPRLAFDMPYYSFGKVLPQVSRE